MSIQFYIKKFVWFKKKHGLLKLLSLIIRNKIWRKYLDNQDVLFFIDLNSMDKRTYNISGIFSVVQYKGIDDISKKDMDHLIAAKSKEVLLPFLKSFFDRGAVFWVAKLDDNVVGYCWSAIRGLNGFHSIPLSLNDAVLYSSEVFPEYRGRAIHPALLYEILVKLKKIGITRVYSSIKVWNKASLRSVPKMGYEKLGTYRELRIFGKYIEIWQPPKLE